MLSTVKFFGWVNVVTLVDRLPICGVFLSLLVVGNLHATEWQEVSRNINLAIYILHRSHSPIEEATYTLYTDGGGISALLLNFANKQSVSRLFDALHARMHDGK